MNAETLLETAASLMEQAQNIIITVAKMADELAAETPVDTWARNYGEVVTVTTAAKVLGVGRNTIYTMINKGELSRTPDGRVSVRSMARWAHSAEQKKPKTLIRVK